jgi:outer membrane protein assembly factor BamB
MLLIYIFLFAGLAIADNWPRFRGPNGSGIGTDQQVPVKWSKDNILWKVPVPGDGNSSPVIWGDRLFVQSATGDGERLLLCLNVKDGKPLWSRTMTGSKAVKHQKNTYASSSPAVDGERVFSAIWDGNNIWMHAFDLDGHPLWKRDLGPFVSQHGAGASPVVFHDKVYYAMDQDGKSTLLCLDARKGHTIWEKPRPDVRASYGAPFIWERIKGTPELVVASTPEVTGYDPDTGDIHWRWAWKHTTPLPLRVVASPVFWGDTVYANAGEGGKNRGLVALKVTGDEKQAKVALSWQNKKDFPYVPTILAHDGLLFYFNDVGAAGCFQAKNGDRLWVERLGAPFTSSPVLAGGKLYAANEAGEVFVLAASPAFTLLAKNELGERVRATPAVAGNRLFVRGRYHLFCIGEPPTK